MTLLLMTEAGGVVVSMCIRLMLSHFPLDFLYSLNNTHTHTQPVPVYILVRALGSYIKKQPEEIE